MGEIVKLVEKTGSQVIPCDVTSLEDIKNLINKAMEIFKGKFDFILHKVRLELEREAQEVLAEKGYDISDENIKIYNRMIALREELDEMSPWITISFMRLGCIFNSSPKIFFAA